MEGTVAEEPSSYIQRALEKKIRNHSAKLGVIGLGYVGLSLAIEMAEKGFRVTGIDIDGRKVEAVNAGLSGILDVPHESFLSVVVNGALRATQSFTAVESLDTISICVPTPLRKNQRSGSLVYHGCRGSGSQPSQAREVGRSRKHDLSRDHAGGCSARIGKVGS
jgi:hypothetical protein